MGNNTWSFSSSSSKIKVWLEVTKLHLGMGSKDESEIEMQIKKETKTGDAPAEEWGSELEEQQRWVLGRMETESFLGGKREGSDKW